MWQKNTHWEKRKFHVCNLYGEFIVTFSDKKMQIFTGNCDKKNV